MRKKMKVAVMTGIGKMDFEERDIPEPKPGEALVKIEYVGVCGSDLHYYENGRISDFVVNPPFVLGHESGGVVVEAGSGVKHLKPGDRVALEPGKTCGHCEFCRTGRYNLCPEVIFFATPPVDGVFQEYAAHEAALCFKLPEKVSTLEGALIEPLAVGFHAAMTGGARIGQTALVTGSGCIGLVSMLALKAQGVSRVYITDVVGKRLEKAKSLGAEEAINVTERDALKALAEREGGLDLVIETTGTDAAAAQGIGALKKGGTMVFVGYSKTGSMTLPMGMALDKELTLKTIFRYRHIYPLAIDAVARGAVDIKSIVTNLFDFDDIRNAMERSVRDKAEIVKSVIKIAR
ncbi:MAG: NAD(P)-dependent alcohol dehydrogenase [Treponema sp.]|nr:NAD(P)-dependent alcohol dehydrogenase [Treponema sp.]